ncbi:MAG: type II secretion system minor pseudopilin GspK [Thiomicrospira sp.]|uniref:type II secretion system minor pseudopilin GspK n=1 Tax=Thiomicrospira sp. TaxID=935 RepID=UPI0019E1A34E|nr:type II secretion system minor pseudopilin GspK [Thiomicrospira sp.]MBE0494036.1 type II secretion system minor pseudopilin GspK [Thiomicrospira sp.]
MHPKRQKGFALLTVLLVVALVATIASSILYQQRLDIQRSAFMLNQSQAMAVAAGIDTWVKKGLAFDASQNQVDHLAEAWAQPMLPMEFEGGDLGGQLLDMQGRFNLNNLAETDETKREAWRSLLERILTRQNLNTDWVAPLIDWVDADNNPIPGGAESDTYLLKNPPYRAANQLMVLVDEVQLLEGLNPAQFRQVRPWLSALPKVSAINVNTAPEPVLLGLAEWMNLSLVQAWLDVRMTEPANETADFRTFLGQMGGGEQNQINQDLPDWMITTQSEFFQLEGLVAYGEANLNARALYYRQDQQVSLLQRWITNADD